ncbi:hypothetical protein [uncultured Kordia sp.]|uniref:hypothetical protein n=1 Tax=uncultured Kordia sp. TaxID=507699 RepID=UPI002617C3AB|nr:hypothetical protein [uncultured Kordia sp.]
MKKTILFIVTLFITLTTFAQSPELINYQAVVRNTDGDLVTEVNVGMRISILQTSATGTAAYTETHTVTTDTNGLLAIMIGGGSTSDDFSAVDWSNGSYFIKTEIDIAGGSNYTIMGTSQLLSVPYALYAKNGSKFTETPNGLEYNGGNITLTQPGATVQLTSPDGTVYDLGINNNGQLSLPTSNAPSTTPTQLYLYGSFNGWDASTALQFGNGFPGFENSFVGIKYFTAGTEFKVLGAQNESVVYGAQGFSSGDLVLNGGAFVVPSNGLYRIEIQIFSNQIFYTIQSINVTFSSVNMTYDTTTDSLFAFLNPFGSSSSTIGVTFRIGDVTYGDNLVDGSIDYQGENITRTGVDQLVQLYLNFNSSGTYLLY